ncbi:hypothetical protein GXW82_16905 [Streptacidiphilus sp. 4-A2]|nr:hypothetical protein [Streptacidiphilus sp. 4-A2]
MAAAVVAAALGELVRGVAAGRDAAGLTGGWSVTLGGGVFRGCPQFAEALRTRIVAELGADPPVVVDDPPRAVLAALRAHGHRLPAALAGRWAWRRPLDGGQG